MKETDKKQPRATVEITLTNGTTNFIPCFSAQIALISALTLVTSSNLSGKIASMSVYSGSKNIFHKAF